MGEGREETGERRRECKRAEMWWDARLHESYEQQASQGGMVGEVGRGELVSGWKVRAGRWEVRGEG